MDHRHECHRKNGCHSNVRLSMISLNCSFSEKKKRTTKEQHTSLTETKQEFGAQALICFRFSERNSGSKLYIIG